MIFVGTRPEVIKLAPVILALQAQPGTSPIVVCTGQHRELVDDALAGFDFKLDEHLNVMRPDQTLAGLTGRLLQAIDEVLVRINPDMAIVQGDTTTTFSAALACVYRKVPVGHVEAGLRSGNPLSPFPEEASRKMVSQIASLHFAPTEESKAHLEREGVSPSAISVTGNTVVDALQWEVARQENPTVAQKLKQDLDNHLGEEWNHTPYVLVTTHRRENFGPGLENICTAVAELANQFKEFAFILPVHLNPRVASIVRERLGAVENVHLISAQPYPAFVYLLGHCKLVLTDSGGIQEEAPSLGKPVLVMRENTERPEGISAGTVTLVGTTTARIVDETAKLLTNPSEYEAMAKAVNPYGDGKAAIRIAKAVAKHVNVI